MKKLSVSWVLTFVSIGVFASSIFLFNGYKDGSVQVKGASVQNDYLMPSSANFISMGKNNEQKDVLVYSTALSKDQVSKFYQELAELRPTNTKPCISSIDFNEDSYNNRLVKVTFCK